MSFMRYVALLALAVYPVLAESGSLTLTVTGGIPVAASFHAADLASMPRQTIEVTATDGSKDEYEGVPVIELLKRVGAPSGPKLRGKALTTYVVGKARDGYQVVYSLAELDPDITQGRFIVADKRNGQALSDSRGPLRLVTGSDKEAVRSIRMLEVLEIVQWKK